jgi:hypothetical protein
VIHELDIIQVFGLGFFICPLTYLKVFDKLKSPEIKKDKEERDEG